MPQYGNGSVEQFGIVLLDTKHKVLQTTILSVGTLDASIVHPREIFREAVGRERGGHRAVPQSSVRRSRTEPGGPRLTERLIAAGVLMGIDVLDHIILGDGRYFSFREKGTL